MLKYTVIVDRGIEHQTNDDAACLKHNIIDDGKFSGRSEKDEGIFAVADGVGSLEGSSAASRIAVSYMAECSPRNGQMIKEQIIKANEKILLERDEMQLHHDLSSTLCLVSVMGERIVSYNLGNSRLYRYRNGSLLQLTKDHSRVQQLCDAGYLKPDEMDDHPDKNIITSFIGHDSFDESWIAVTSHREKFKSGDLLMMCSDGLYDYMGIDCMEKIMGCDMTIEQKAAKMVENVNESGGYDNVTVLIVEKCQSVSG